MVLSREGEGMGGGPVQGEINDHSFLRGDVVLSRGGGPVQGEINDHSFLGGGGGPVRGEVTWSRGRVTWSRGGDHRQRKVLAKTHIV